MNKIKEICCLVIGIMLLAVSAEAQKKVDVGCGTSKKGNQIMSTILYVSPDGLDYNDGISKPKATIAAAISEMKRLHGCGALSFPAIIELKGGIYYQTKPLMIDTDFPLIIRGAAGETAVIDGVTPLKDWKEVTVNGKPAWQAKTSGMVLSMYFRGQTLKRASFPKGDALYRVRDVPAPGAYYANGSTHFLPEEGSFHGDWYNLQGIDCHFYHWWVEEYLPVERYDAENDEVHSTHRTRYMMNNSNTEYRIENVREALTEVGEFYYDSLQNTVTVITGESLDSTADRPEMSLKGDLVRIVNARFLTLQNLVIRHAGGYRPQNTSFYDINGLQIRNYQLQSGWIEDKKAKPYGTSAQGAVRVPGTVILSHSRDCDIKNCTVTESGWYGIDVTAGCSNIRLERNHLHHLGAGAIRIGGASKNEDKDELTSRVIVKNNHIHDCGQVYESSVGILITHAFGNLVEHNHIHDLYYSGISVGWIWGYKDSVTRENRIGWNLIHDIGKNLLSDMGGIYLLGIQPGTRVYSNRVYNVRKRYYGGWAIYTDEGSSHIVVENNVCSDCSSDVYHQHYGRENTLRYNIFAFGEDAVLCMSRGDEQMNVYPGRNFSNALASYNNVLVSAGKPFIRSQHQENLVLPIFLSENTIFYNVDGDFPPIASTTGDPDKPQFNLTEWQGRGFDRGAICNVDPGFKDLANRDFSFGPDSLLAKLHFPMLDMSKVGIEPEE
ncbi:MAG: right-handed parallel beta-helix repeat-containing protein [Victivallales bacterium]|nr:right-handed parallel beta-helix repeat-containing protein [Victivallales bacterium]